MDNENQTQAEHLDDKPWAARLGELKPKLVAAMRESGQNPKELIGFLLDLRERELRKTELEAIPEIDGIRHHLNTVSKLVESGMVLKIDEIARLRDSMSQSDADHLRRQMEAQRRVNELSDAIEAMGAESQSNKNLIAQLNSKINEIEVEKKSLIRISTATQELLDQSKFKIETFDDIQSSLKMSNLQLSTAKQEKERLQTYLEEEKQKSATATQEIASITQINEKLKSDLAQVKTIVEEQTQFLNQRANEIEELKRQHDMEKKKILERSQFELEKAVFAQKIESDKVLNQLRQSSSMREREHNQ